MAETRAAIIQIRLNEDPAFIAEGIRVDRIVFTAGKAIATFERTASATRLQINAVAVVDDSPDSNVVENSLFARIYGKVACA